MECTCIVKHAVTDEERAEVSKNLAYFRSIGDSMGAMMQLWMLQPCPKMGVNVGK